MFQPMSNIHLALICASRLLSYFLLYVTSLIWKVVYDMNVFIWLSMIGYGSGSHQNEEKSTMYDNDVNLVVPNTLQVRYSATRS